LSVFDGTSIYKGSLAIVGQVQKYIGNLNAPITKKGFRGMIPETSIKRNVFRRIRSHTAQYIQFY
jgi:hypothetical protein